MPTITFTVFVGIRGPIPPGDYEVRKKRIAVSYPSGVFIAGVGPVELPKSLSTRFVVSWEDESGSDTSMVKIATEIRRTAPDSTMFAVPPQYREVPFGLPPALAPGPAASPK